MLYLLLNSHHNYQVKKNWWLRFVINLFNIVNRSHIGEYVGLSDFVPITTSANLLCTFELNRQINRSVASMLSQSVVAVGVIILKLPIWAVFSKFTTVYLVLIVFSVVFMYVKSFAIVMNSCSSSTILISWNHIHLQNRCIWSLV